MHDIHQALDVLRELTGQADLSFGAGEHVEILFDGVPVGFVAVGRHHFEMVTPVADLRTALTRDVLSRLMTANYLGTATGSARLAYDPGRQRITLCERLDLATLDAGSLKARLIEFLATANFWNGDRGRELAAGPKQADPEPLPNDQFIIRG